MKFIEPNKYIADKGKAFKRTYNGFAKIEDNNYYPTLILGKILLDNDGELLSTPIDDKIQYYEEVELPKEEHVDQFNKRGIEKDSE